MRQTFRLGRISGIPVGASWSAIVTVVLIADLLATSALPAAAPRLPVAVYWAAGVAGAVTFLASLLAHELAHALVARRAGITVRSVTLWMLGGVTQIDGEPATAGTDLRMALAGPAASLVAGGVFFGAAAAISSVGGPRVATVTAVWLALMNGVLAAFNLLPGVPLDGGRVLRAALWRRWGNRQRAERAAATAGRGIGVALSVLGVLDVLLARDLPGGLWLVLLGWFMTSAAGAEQQAAADRARLAGVLAADIMIPDPDVAPAWLTVSGLTRHLGVLSSQAAYPVIGPGGELAGVVSLTRLARLTEARWDQVRLGELAVPVPAGYLAAPGDPVAPMLSREPLDGAVVAIVQAGGRITGLITTQSLRQALRRGPPGTTRSRALTP